MNLKDLVVDATAIRLHEVVERFGISRRMLFKWRKQGKIVAIGTKRDVRIPLSQIPKLHALAKKPLDSTSDISLGSGIGTSLYAPRGTIRPLDSARECPLCKSTLAECRSEGVDA